MYSGSAGTEVLTFIIWLYSFTLLLAEDAVLRDARWLWAERYRPLGFMSIWSLKDGEKSRMLR